MTDSEGKALWHVVTRLQEAAAACRQDAAACGDLGAANRSLQYQWNATATAYEYAAILLENALNRLARK